MYGGQKFRKDSEVARWGSSWRCVRPACRGRMKISVGRDGALVESTTFYRRVVGSAPALAVT